MIEDDGPFPCCNEGCPHAAFWWVGLSDDDATHSCDACVPLLKNPDDVVLPLGTA